MPDPVQLDGSDRRPVPGAPAGSIDPNERVELTLVLRRRADLAVAELPQPLSREQLAERYGADAADVERVRAALADLEIVRVDPASRRVIVAGPAGRLAERFGASLSRTTSTDPATGREVTHRAREGALQVPPELDGIVVAVLGLDDRPQANTRFRIAPEATATSYTPLQLGRIYDAPANTDGSGQTLAIVELGGGFGQDDLDTYFSGLGITAPKVTAVGVDGAANEPGQDPNGPDGEVLLDIEVAGALAPGADIVVYFAPNTDRGFLDAVSTAVHASPTPTAVSISWGQSEDAWTGQARTALDQAFADGAALGVTVCVASGDGGSTDGQSDGRPHVDFPASSPNALACGGTTLDADASSGAVTSETVWPDGGGGVSDVFDRPSWQVEAGVPGGGRGVPDVAGDADPSTGYEVLVDGERLQIGGTSAVAPLWAALVCRLAERLGRPLGLAQPALYANAAPGRTPPGFRDITSGSNGDFDAAPGWDPCTGLGVPVGEALAQALT
jgi:kumamolisin